MSTPQRTIRLIIEGLALLFFKKNDAGQYTHCLAAVLDERHATDHRFELLIQRPGHVDIRHPMTGRGLTLDVQGTTSTGITLEGEGQTIHRPSGTIRENEQSIEWLLDFERELYGGRPLGVRRSELRPVLMINNGRFFTQQSSVNQLLVHPEHNPAQITNVGTVATEIGVDITLDQPGSRAELRNGRGAGQPKFFEAKPGDQYTLKIGLEEPPGAGAHANFYYAAIGHRLGSGEKKVFSSTPMPLLSPLMASPEAACLVGRMGMTDLPDDET